jgi:hypothetical protein
MHQVEESVSVEKIRDLLRQLEQKDGPQFKKKFYDLMLSVMESQPKLSPEDTILINTILYLKFGTRWKDAIKEYWRNKD